LSAAGLSSTFGAGDQQAAGGRWPSGPVVMWGGGGLLVPSVYCVMDKPSTV
jgi:hypothetical protein